MRFMFSVAVAAAAAILFLGCGSTEETEGPDAQSPTMTAGQASSPTPTSMAAATIVVDPVTGPNETTIIIKGENFIPSDTVFIEILPASGGNGGTYRMANVQADEAGRFESKLVIGRGFPGPDFPDTALPSADDLLPLFPMEYVIMAYAESFGGRTEQTIEQAPKVEFTVTESVTGSSADGYR